MTALAAPGGLSATVSASGSVTLARTDTNSDEVAADAVAYEDASEI